jgi:glycosyltransferase involved in cell wall biosynthesis
VESLVQKYKLEERLNRPGFVADLEPYLATADIVVLPSRLDGMPLIVLEAQARGKAVVASRVGSLPHIIEHQATGFLCEPENVEEFCSCIARLADDPVLRREIGRAARVAAAERHGEDKMLAEYDAVFNPVDKASMAQAQR